MHPNKPQLTWIKNSIKSVNVWAAGNSGGKSFGSALKALYYATYKIKPGKTFLSYEEWRQAEYKILLAGPESKQAMSLFEQVERLYMNSPFLSQQVENITTGTKRDPHSKITLADNRGIYAISTKNKGKHIESGDYDLIIFDEPADETHLEYVIEKVLQPRMFRRGGILDLVGTPKDNPTFMDFYRRGCPIGDDYYDDRFSDPINNYSMNSSSFDNEFADQEAIKNYSETKDSDLINERLYGKFVSFSNSAFPESSIHLCYDPNFPEHIEPSGGRIYVTGVDFGRKDDYTVAVTLDCTEPLWTVVDFGRWGGGNVSWEFIFSQLSGIFNKYKSEFFVDATSSGGDVQAEWLAGLGIYYKPFIYNPAKKGALINNLQDVLGRGMIKFGPHKELRDELRYYPKDLNDAHFVTDSVMSLALACLRAKDFGPEGEPYEY